MKVRSRHHLRKLIDLAAEGVISKKYLKDMTRGVDTSKLPDKVNHAR